MPRERQSITPEFSLGGHDGYITAGMYHDGSVGEIFLTDVRQGGLDPPRHDELGRDRDVDRAAVSVRRHDAANGLVLHVLELRQQHRLRLSQNVPRAVPLTVTRCPEGPTDAGPSCLDWS
jgi:hypothetical protein